MRSGDSIRAILMAAFFGAAIWSMAIWSAASASAAPRADDGRPAIFSDVPYDAALAKNTEKGDYLLVKATAAWCVPCKLMNRTTWAADDVVAWVRQHGTAIELDVDQNKETSQALGITSMPTTIAFKGGKEIDRLVGYRTPTDLLKWLAGVENGETAGTRLAKRLEGVESLGMQARLQLAQELLDARVYDQALTQFDWLWQHMVEREPAMSGVRGSFMVYDIARLTTTYEPAAARFTELRDDAEATLKGPNKTFDDLRDWINLNRALAQPDKTLEWIDRVKGDDDGRSTIRDVWYLVEPVLEESERWSDLALLSENPKAWLRRAFEQWDLERKAPPIEGLTEQQLKDIRAVRDRVFRDKAGKLYAGLLASGRDADAVEYAEQAARLDNAGEMPAALVEWAVRAGQARGEHRTMLDSAKAKGVDVTGLRSAVDEMLAKK